MHPPWSGTWSYPRIEPSSGLAPVLSGRWCRNVVFPHKVCSFPDGFALAKKTDITFIPGHGPTSTFGQERLTNPFVADSQYG